MKIARWLTLLGSLVLIGSAIFHLTGYTSIQRSTDGVLKALWLTFSVLLLGLAAIALLARGMGRGGLVVLSCGATTGVTALLLLRFLGPFIGFYLLTVVTVLFLVGGWIQAKNQN